MHRIIMLIVDVKNGMKGHVFKMAAVFELTKFYLRIGWFISCEKTTSVLSEIFI